MLNHPSSFYDCDMDWTKPNPMQQKYYEAVVSALMENESNRYYYDTWPDREGTLFNPGEDFNLDQLLNDPTSYLDGYDLIKVDECTYNVKDHILKVQQDLRDFKGEVIDDAALSAISDRLKLIRDWLSIRGYYYWINDIYTVDHTIHSRSITYKFDPETVTASQIMTAYNLAANDFVHNLSSNIPGATKIINYDRYIQNASTTSRKKAFKYDDGTQGGSYQFFTFTEVVMLADGGDVPIPSSITHNVSDKSVFFYSFMPVGDIERNFHIIDYKGPKDYIISHSTPASYRINLSQEVNYDISDRKQTALLSAMSGNIEFYESISKETANFLLNKKMYIGEIYIYLNEVYLDLNCEGGFVFR